MDIDNFNKISKYVNRLNVSLNKQQMTKAKEYFDHLQFHIQFGGLDSKNDESKIEESVDSKIKELTKFGEQLDNIIKNVSDEKYTFNNSSEIQEQLTKCNDEKKTLNEQINALQQTLKTTSESLTELKPTENNEQLNADIASLNEEKTKLQNEIKSLTVDSEQNTKKIKEIQEKLNKILNLTDITQKSIDDSIDEISKKIVKYSNIIVEILELSGEEQNKDRNDEKINDALQNIKLKLDSSNTQAQELDKSKKTISDLNDKIKTLENDVGQITKLTQKINDADKEINDLTAITKEQKTIIDNFEKNQIDVSNKLEESVKTLNTKLQSLLKTIYGDKLSEILLSGNQVGGYM